MKMPIVFTLAILSAISAHAQTTTFSLTSQAVTLPGGKSTLVGVSTGIALTVTPNFDLREENFIASQANSMIFLGGFNYRLPILQTKLNNMSPTLNGFRFQFYITASAGVNRLALSSGTISHSALLAGGGLNYDMTSTGRWTFGAEIRYARLPGMAMNSAIVAIGPTLHF